MPPAYPIEIGSIPALFLLQKQRHPQGVPLFLEQGTGIEPASEAWEATIIADILTLRLFWYYNRTKWKIQPFFVDGRMLAFCRLPW